jgi:hypothetical protein
MPEPASTITYTATVTTGARTQLPSASARMVSFRAAKTNSAAIWLGGSTVTTAGAGLVLCDLQPGEIFFFNDSATTEIYTASAASQSLYVTTFL